MRRVKRRIENCHRDKFAVLCLSAQGVIMDDDSDEALFRQLPRVLKDGAGIEVEAPKSWDDWMACFSVKHGLFEKPLVLFIDEFDSLAPKWIDRKPG